MTRRNNKYNARKCVFDNIKFDSMRERDRYIYLRDRQMRGEIADLTLQVPIMLEGQDGPLLTRTGRKMRITVDFRYIDLATGLTIWEDSKGMVTRDYEVRRSVAAAQGIEIKEV